MSAYSSKKLTKLTGNFREILVSFLLLKKYGSKNLTIIRTGAEHLPYDLLIPHGARETPFEKPAVISVKTRDEWKVKSPWRNRLPWDYEKIKEALGIIGGDYEFWLAFVRYTYNDDGLSFEVYMAKAKDFEENNFMKFKKKVESENKLEEMTSSNWSWNDGIMLLDLIFASRIPILSQLRS
ncbi:hypothetical protein J7L18_02105 [Candidatus Bathyarchaeota archaeon]|nr:hypothetical protein [Candidatus Bathyarchaeota archaeon]